MLRLRTFHGLHEVFGVVTSCERWRFYWLPDCDTVAASPGPATSPTLDLGEEKLPENTRNIEDMDTNPILEISKEPDAAR